MAGGFRKLDLEYDFRWRHCLELVFICLHLGTRRTSVVALGILRPNPRPHPDCLHLDRRRPPLQFLASCRLCLDHYLGHLPVRHAGHLVLEDFVDVFCLDLAILPPFPQGLYATSPFFVLPRRT